jgi:aerobic-type carbon monoxide dehydrogenase small subunit (CoxS/CutS family)
MARFDVRWALAAVMTLGLVAAAATTRAKAEEKEKEEGEVKVKFDEVPAAVKATLTKEANGAKIETVDKETDDGKTIYEADVTINGKNYEIKVATDGTLISKKLDEEGEEKGEKGEKDEKGEKGEKHEHGKKSEKD